MKKIILMLVGISIIVACNNEPKGSSSQQIKEEPSQHMQEYPQERQKQIIFTEDILSRMPPELEYEPEKKQEFDEYDVPEETEEEEEKEIDPVQEELYEKLRAASMEPGEHEKEIERIITAIKEQNPKQFALYEKLCTASKEGNLQEVKKLIAEGANVNYLKINETMFSGCIECMQYYEPTPLTLASKNNHLQVAKELVKAGAKDKYADAFNAACYNGIDIAVFLAKSISYRRDPDTILFCASVSGNVELLNISLEEGADVNMLFGEGARSPLILASENDHKEVVQALIDAGADVNYSDDEGDSVLFSAAGSGNYHYIESSNTDIYEFSDNRIEIIQALIKAGADVNHKNNKGQTVLAYIQDRITYCTGKRDTSRKCIINGMKTLEKIIEVLKQAGAKE